MPGKIAQRRALRNPSTRYRALSFQCEFWLFDSDKDCARGRCNRFQALCGAVAEWSKALAWKVSIRQNRIEGSNPSRSAKNNEFPTLISVIVEFAHEKAHERSLIVGEPF